MAEVDISQNYMPDPFALQISALILQRRACFLDLPEETVKALQLWSGRFLEVGQYLQETSGRANPFDPLAEEVPTPPEAAFSDAEFVCLTQRVTPLSLGHEIRHYRLVHKGAEQCSRLRPTAKTAGAIAVLDLIQHEQGNWEVFHAETIPGFRRQGLMSRLYAHHELSAQTELVVPSGWITDDGREYWLQRRPDFMQYYLQHPEFPGLWTSMKQLLNLEYVLGFMLTFAASMDYPN